MYEPQRRVPFGFRGDWGTLYKRYTDNCKLNLKNDTIVYEKNNYIDIGASIQFKPTGDVTTDIEYTTKGLQTKVTYMTIETTDAYYDDNLKDFVCCVEIGDIVKVFNKLWIVTNIKETVKFCPKKISFYYCDIKSLV